MSNNSYGKNYYVKFQQRRESFRNHFCCFCFLYSLILSHECTMHQEVTLNLTTIRLDGQLKEREDDEDNSSLRNTAYENCCLKENPLFPNCCSSEEEDIPPVLKRYSEVSVDLESCYSPRSPPDLSIPGVSVMETNKKEIISTNNAGLREVNKFGLDSYSFTERDKIDGKIFHSFVTQKDLESFANGRASYQGEKLTNQFSASNAGLTSIKHISEREMEKSRPLCEKNIAVFTIDDDDDVNETSPSDSSVDPEEIMIIEYQNVKPDDAQNVSTKLDPESLETVMLDRKRNVDKRESSFLIIPEETYFEDYDVPSPLKRDEFRFVAECSKRFCIMGCVCSSLNILKPRLRRCNHLECIFDNGCIKKSKMTISVTQPSPATEGDTFEGLPQLSRKKEVNLQNEIDDLTIRLLQKDEEVEKLRKIIDEQAVLLESKAIMPIKVAKTDEFKMVNGKRVQDGLYVDSFPLKEHMLNRLAKNTTASLFIRQLMREMFTPEYCSSKTFKLIKQEHVMAIIEATKERFSVYRGNNGSESKLTEEKIKSVMQSVLSMAKPKKISQPLKPSSLKPS